MQQILQYNVLIKNGSETRNVFAHRRAFEIAKS